MVNKKLIYLTIVVALLAAIAAAGGLLVDGLYRDNDFIVAGWLGNDFMTLTLAAPALLLAVLVGQHGRRARLVWLGLLHYMLYNFAFYLFGGMFNAFFLLYELLVVLSLIALVFGLIVTKPPQNKALASQGQTTVFRFVPLYMLLVATMLTAVYLSQTLSFVQHGQLPPIIQLTEHPTSVVFALDLLLIVPWFLFGAVWLWQKRPWGFVISVIINVSGAFYMLSLLAATITAVWANTAADPSELYIWSVLALCNAICVVLLLRSWQPALPNHPRAA